MCLITNNFIQAFQQYINYNKDKAQIAMKKIQHFSVPQILKKRTQISFKNRSSRKIIQQSQKDSRTKFSDEKQLNYDQILYQIIDKIQVNGPESISNEQKGKLIDLISQKAGLHLNKQKIISKTAIKTVKHIQIIDKIYQQSVAGKQKQVRSIFKIKQEESKNKSQKKKDYFLLSGSMTILSANPFDKQRQSNQKQQSRKNSIKGQQQSEQTTFFNKKQLYDEFPNYFQLKTIHQQTGYGNLFDCSKNIEFFKSKQLQKQPYKNNQITFSTTQPLSIQINTKKTNVSKTLMHLMNLPKLVVCENAIYIQIQSGEFDNQYINLSGLSLEAIQDILQKFKIFEPLGKKIKNYIQFFQLKEFHRNQKIYQANEKADKFYLLIKGQVVIQSEQSKNQMVAQGSNGVSRITSPQRSHSNSINQAKYCLKTQTLSAGSYFGQQQFIYSIQKRLFSAVCKSSYCQVLYITGQRFQKMLDYSDFADVIKKAATIKYKKRQQKIIKSNSIRKKFTITQYNQDKSKQLNSPLSPQRQTVNLFRSRRGSVDSKYKVMHGNIIKTFTNDKNAKLKQDIQFSMLGANPDMYQSTLKKFRKFKQIVPNKKKIEIGYNLQRVWKVLNLQNVLRQDSQVTSPQGRKYYDSHKRFINQLSQSKTLRPKTSSTTYRTKLQYIAYLQQFKN